MNNRTTINITKESRFKLKEFVVLNRIDDYDAAINYLLNLAKESKEKEKE